MANEGLVGPGIKPQGGTSPAASTFNRGSVQYDTPFLDMTSTYIPKTIKGILKFIAAFLFGDSIISQCVIKLSEYPITSLIYNDDNELILKNDKTIEFWKDFLENKLKIINSMKQSGMDFWGYGNSIISIHYPFKRFFECPNCKEDFPSDSVKYKFSNYQFEGKCVKCDKEVKFKAYDKNTSEIEKFNLIHWDLLYIDIKFNCISGDHFYYYTIPQYLSNAIKSGDMDIVKTTRLEIIKSVETNKPLKLMNDNVFHMKRLGPQYMYPSERGWGIPVVMPVIKDAFHNKILKKANEMIAFDHILPLRILFPLGTGDISPHAIINLSTWKNKIEQEIVKWKSDNNYISIVPLPIGMVNFSGDAKALMVTPEIKATEDTIITGIGVIPEIIKGGASWSGSNVSLRIVENTFINHRKGEDDLLQWVIKKISTYINKVPCKVKMSDFKMADDLQKKQMLLQSAMGSPSTTLISKSTMTKELGYEPQKEYELKLKELVQNIELLIRESEGNAESQGAATVIGAMYNANAQIAEKERLESKEREMQTKRNKEDQIRNAESADVVAQEIDTIGYEKGYPPGTIELPQLIMLITQRFVNLIKADINEFKLRMLTMKNSMPALYEIIYNNLKEMNLITADLIPDLGVAQKYTPGEIPTYIQGDTYASSEPSPVEMGLSPGEANTSIKYNKPLPEARPPVSPNAPI
jgi:hypothetical protein